MKKILFLNLTNHSLTEEQINAVHELGGTIINFADLTNEDLVKEVSHPSTIAANVVQAVKDIIPKLKNSPADSFELYKVSDTLFDILNIIGQGDWNRVYVHMPIGSPSFMFLVAHMWNERLGYLGKVVPIFSHSERIVQETKREDGSIEKRTTFKFQKFIVPFEG